MGRKFTPAKAEANSRYLSQFKQFVVRMKEEDLKELDAAAMTAGKTRAEFVKDALAEAMKRTGS